MNAIFVNSKNSKTSDSHRLLLNFTNEIDLKIKDKYIPLTNPSIYYTWKKNRIRIINLKYQLQNRMKNLNYMTDHVMYQMLTIILNITKLFRRRVSIIL